MSREERHFSILWQGVYFSRGSKKSETSVVHRWKTFDALIA